MPAARVWSAFVCTRFIGTTRLSKTYARDGDELDQISTVHPSRSLVPAVSRRGTLARRRASERGYRTGLRRPRARGIASCRWASRAGFDQPFSQTLDRMAGLSKTRTLHAIAHIGLGFVLPIATSVRSARGQLIFIYDAVPVKSDCLR